MRRVVVVSSTAMQSNDEDNTNDGKRIERIKKEKEGKLLNTFRDR